MSRQEIAKEIEGECVRQDQKWGAMRDYFDVDPILMDRPGGVTAERMAEHYEIPTEYRAQQMCRTAPKNGGDTWVNILLEEFAEAVQAATEKTREDLRIELIQVAAVTIQWIDNLDRRESNVE